MPKLDDREKKCLLEIQSHSSNQYEPTLSFTQSENLPYMTNNLQITVNGQYNRLITATKDIPIGSTVLIKEDYIRLAVGDNIKCCTCGKENLNFFPCKNCGGTLFCSSLCSMNSFHQTECNLLFDMNVFFYRFRQFGLIISDRCTQVTYGPFVLPSHH